MNAYAWLAVSIAGLYTGLVWAYVAVMHAKAVLERGEQIHWVFKGPLYLLLAIGLPLDIAWNVIAGTLMFQELPRELTFTSRLKRWKAEGGRRGQRARWWAAELNKFDPGHV